jgi:hypothetical protein
LSDVTDAGSGAIITDAERTKLNGIEASATGDQTGAEIKTAYEQEAKAFTDAQFDKLAAIETSATANSTDATLLARANHTGTQTAATISDFDTEVSNNASVTANTAKVSADGLVTTHSDVTDAGSGAIITDAERTKLNGIEASATGDQTGAEIKTAYEQEAKAFTDAQFDKLAAIEASATADQTGAEIKALYEAEANAFTDAQFTKLAGIEAAADVTDAANVAAAGAVMNTGDETIAGAKTFSSTIQGDLNGDVAGDVTGTVSSIANHSTTNLSEGTNLYYTDARSRLAMSATDAGGDGSFSYDNTTGAMTYTGPSAAETRAHFSGGTGVTITDGSVAIGQAVATTDAVTFASATTTGNVAIGGTLGATGATTLGSTLDVTGNTEVDGTLGADGNFRVGASGASKFSVDAASGAITTSGDLVMTNGTIVAGALQVSGATTLNSADVATMSISTTLTVPTPSFGAAAANKSYVDNHVSTMPQAFSYLSGGTYTGLGADLGAAAVTITVTGANLAAGTYKLHLAGHETTLTVTVVDANTVTFDLTDSDVSGMTSRTGLLAAQLSIDGIATGLNIFVNL